MDDGPHPIWYVLLAAVLILLSVGMIVDTLHKYAALGGHGRMSAMGVFRPRSLPLSYAVFLDSIPALLGLYVGWRALVALKRIAEIS